MLDNTAILGLITLKMNDQFLPSLSVEFTHSCHLQKLYPRYHRYHVEGHKFLSRSC